MLTKLWSLRNSIICHLQTTDCRFKKASHVIQSYSKDLRTRRANDETPVWKQDEISLLKEISRKKKWFFLLLPFGLMRPSTGLEEAYSHCEWAFLTYWVQILISSRNAFTNLNSKTQFSLLQFAHLYLHMSLLLPDIPLLKNISVLDWKCRSVAEWFPTIYEDFSQIPSTEKKSLNTS